MKLVWTDTARAHLRGIHDYIAQDSAKYALAVVDRILRRADQCGAFPLSGGRVPEYESDDLRELLQHPYRIVYRVKPERVEIVAVIHSARQLPQSMS